MKIVGITQARVGSTRLPGKILLRIKDKTLLQYHLQRAAQSVTVEDWIVATTNEEGSDQIVTIADSCHIKAFKGDTHNVLKRFYDALKGSHADYIVRITSDCPLIDPELIDKVVTHAVSNNLDYCSTSNTYPDGMDVEVFRFSVLEECYHKATLPSDKEHVTPYIRRNAKAEHSFSDCSEDFSAVRLTVDEPEDFNTIQRVIEELGINESWNTYARFIVANPSLFKNQQIIRNEGYLKSKENDSKHQ